MRIPGLGAKVLDEFGVKNDKELYPKGFNPSDSPDMRSHPGGLAPNDIQKALKQFYEDPRTGLDAGEWIGPHDDIALNLNKTRAKYYYYPGWWEPSTTFDILVNSKAWNDLPNPYQTVFKSVCRDTYDYILAKYLRSNYLGLQKLRDSGIIIQRFPNEFLNAAKEKTDTLLNDYGRYDKAFAEVHKDWTVFRDNYRGWYKYTDLTAT